MWFIIICLLFISYQNFFQASSACFLKLDPPPKPPINELGLISHLLTTANITIDNFYQRLGITRRNLEIYKFDIQQIIDNILLKSKETFLKFTEEAQKQINECKKRAEKLGIDIKECFKENEEELLGLPMKFLQYELSCVTKEINDGTQMIKDSEQLIRDITSSVLQATGALQTCASLGPAQVIGCIKDVIKHLGDVGSKVSLNKLISRKFGCCKNNY